MNRAQLADERGVTLIELVLAASMMLLVFGATLSLLTSATRHQKLNQEHNDAQDVARTTVDRLARELRNLAAPTRTDGVAVSSGFLTDPVAIDRNRPYDFIFQTVGDAAASANTGNVKRVRYCLDAATSVLWRQEQTWTTAVAPAMPPASACPGPGWDVGRDRQVAAVVNRDGGKDRPVFRFGADTGSITAEDAEARKRISRVRADIVVDPTPGRAPVESRLTTALFLRNQNREPTVKFTATPLDAVLRTIDLNGSASSDPEGQSLRYEFYRDPPEPLPDCNPKASNGGDLPTPASCIGRGGPSRILHTAPDLLSHAYVLRITDSAGRRSAVRLQAGFLP